MEDNAAKFPGYMSFFSNSKLYSPYTTKRKIKLSTFDLLKLRNKQNEILAVVIYKKRT